ncbi:MAG: DNA methyltransferase [Candidatus Muiribacteriota bacterium]
MQLEYTLYKKNEDNADINIYFNTFLKNFKLNADKPETIFYKKSINNQKINFYINEFWTSKQRQGSSLHEISYRACFKPQLPEFFISRLTKENDIVYDPFGGRGTTIVQAALQNRIGWANDINPLSKILASPRLNPPSLKEIKNRLDNINLNVEINSDIDLSMFYHSDTLKEILSLKQYFIEKNGKSDYIDNWIQMVATNRLTGHSKGFFSVYTLPPNQAASQKRQVKLNEKRNLSPEYRNVKELILKKSKQLLKKISTAEIKILKNNSKKHKFFCSDAANTDKIPPNSVSLTVTSPPFLDIVQYSNDNWLRCFFNNIDDKKISKKITMSKKITDWEKVMQQVLFELYRITIPGGWVCFEVGEVKKGSINLEEHIVPLGIKAGFKCFGILINKQKFTKTANIWGVNNNKGGTNSNRIAIFLKKK